MKKKLLSLCLALVLVLGCLPISVSAAGDTVLTLDTEVTVPFTVPTGTTDTELKVPLGTFTASEEGIYILNGTQNATNFNQFCDCCRYTVEGISGSEPRIITEDLNIIERTSGITAVYLSAGEAVSCFASVVPNSWLSLADLDALDTKSFTVSVTKVAADHMGTIAFSEEVSITNSAGLYTPDSYFFYRFTAPTDGYYIPIFERHYGGVQSRGGLGYFAEFSNLEFDKTGNKTEPGVRFNYGAFLKQGHSSYAVFSSTSNDATFTLTIEQKGPIAAVTADSEYQAANLTSTTKGGYLGKFTPMVSGNYLINASLTTSNDGDLFVLDETGYQVVGKHIDAYKDISLTVNLSAGTSYIIAIDKPITWTDFDFTLNITKETLPTLTGTVNITGTEKFGQTLRASVSGGNSPSNAFTYTWKRGGSAIATGAAYTLTETDVGQTLTCEVTASDRSGSISKTTGVIDRAAGPAAPAGLKGVCPTAADATDGKITGTTTAMEYSTDRNFASPAGTPCSANETTGLAPGTYYVRAAATTTTEAGAVTTVTVPVYVAPKVTPVVVSPASGLVLKGYTRQYTAAVNGKGAYDKTVTWSVTGGTAGTSISSTGLLTVSADEELSTVLTITATSVGDNTKTGTATVTVTEYIPTPPIGDDTPDEPEAPTEPTVETETAPDGTVTTTTTWTDGKKAVQEKAPDGSAKVEVTSSTGETIAKVELPADPGAGRDFEDVKEDAWYESAVDKATAYGLFNGQTETTFAPNGNMTRGMVAQVLYNLSGKTGYGAGSGNFTDVAAGKWYENAIDWAAKAGIVSGMGGGKFDPERAVTREQLVTMLYRYAQTIGADTKASMGLGSFPDSGEVTDYAETAMKWAVAEGFISGREQSGGNYIAPKGTATRAEVAAILTRFVEFLK